jgi:DNA polymerase III epsilon subunit-like protein
MGFSVSFNKNAQLPRQVALEMKLSEPKAGEARKITEIAALEMRGGRPTGVEFHAVFGAEKEFSKTMSALRRFIGGDTVVFCPAKDACKDGKLPPDIAFLNSVFAKIGQDVIPDQQLQSLRQMTDKIFGDKAVPLEKMLVRYELSLPESAAPEHRALSHARQLAGVYSSVARDFTAFLSRQAVAAKAAVTPKSQPG